MLLLASTGSDTSISIQDDGLQVIRVEPGQTGVNFSLKTIDEVVLLLEDGEAADLQYKVALGAQENMVTWLSQISGGSKGKKFRHAGWSSWEGRAGRQLISGIL